MKTHLTLALSALLIAGAAGAARGQAVSITVPDANPSNWKEYAPPGGGFSVLIPGVPRRQTRQMPLGNGQTIPSHIHLGSWFAEYGIIYTDFPFTVPGPEAAKRILDNAAKGAAAKLNAELLHISEVTLDGRLGIALEEKLPDGRIMRARLYLDGSRLYQVAVTTPDEKGAPASAVKFNEEIATKFLDSFKLTGTRAQDSPAVAPPPVPPRPAEGEVDRLARELKARNEVVLGVCEDLEKCKPLPGDIKIENGQVISKPQPAYPPIANAARAHGSVRVLLIVDEEGKVVAAQAVGGHPLLQLAAVKAAREARFTPTLMNGKPVKVSGAITYNFVLE